jgi:hypothetical protein
VFVGVVLASFFGMMNRVQVVAMRYMSVVAGLHVIACGMVFRRGAMMFRGLFMMLGRLRVMIDTML